MHGCRVLIGQTDMKIAKGIRLQRGKVDNFTTHLQRLFPNARREFSHPRHNGVSRSLLYMAQNYTRPIQIRDLVSHSGMSRRGFMKAFNQHMGCTPGSFIRQARIEFAKQLLIKQDLPLKTIATAVGFRNENTFCIAFSRATGMAPKKFQRQVWLSVYNTKSS